MEYPGEVEEKTLLWTPQRVLESVALLHIPTMDDIHRLEPECISFTSSFFGVTDTVTLEGAEYELKGVYFLLLEFRRLMQGGDPNPTAAHPPQVVRAQTALQNVFLGDTVALAIILSRTKLTLEDITTFRRETVIAIFDLHVRDGVPVRQAIELVYG